MPIRLNLRRAMANLGLRRTAIPQEFTIGLDEPQAEVSIWLHGAGKPRDVTRRSTTACTAPLTLCIGFDPGELPQAGRGDLLLELRSRTRGECPLGEIRLAFESSLTAGGMELGLFRVLGSANHCLPQLRLWSHYLRQAYSHWRRDDPEDIRMTLVEERAACVTFIRPHFLYLVSVGDASSGNMFPMNLVGELGGNYIGFGLREQRTAAHIVEETGRVALSGVPLDHCPLVFQLAVNHRKKQIGWDELPFQTQPSSTWGIPIPDFATRVRELHVEAVRRIGSHRFFVARIVSDETYHRAQQACVVHGFYQYWRLRGQEAELAASVADHYLHKRGRQPSP